MAEVATGKAKRASRRRRVLAGCAGALVLALLLSCAGTWALFFRTRGVPAGRSVQVEIPKGADTRTIAVRLASAGVVGNANMFMLRSKLNGSDGRLKAGVYEFTTGTDYETVLLRLEEGPPVMYFNLTIPEGFTLAQIAQRVQAKTGVKADEFRLVATTKAHQFEAEHPNLRFNTTDSLEGYLFPKTYRVKKGATAAEVIDMMLDQFDKEIATIDMTYAQSKNLTVHDVVTIASMVERETRLPKERPVVASVIYNRLKRGMRLEIDATVQYVLGNKPRLLYRDLRVQSPYNTYLHKGLPPGAIASPGLASIEAAAKPSETEYIYYVLTRKDGGHTFATNKADFDRAKARAREGLR